MTASVMRRNFFSFMFSSIPTWPYRTTTLEGTVRLLRRSFSIPPTWSLNFLKPPLLRLGYLRTLYYSTSSGDHCRSRLNMRNGGTVSERRIEHTGDLNCSEVEMHNFLNIFFKLSFINLKRYSITVLQKG